MQRQHQLDLRAARQRKKKLELLTKFLVKNLCDNFEIKPRHFFKRTRDETIISLRWCICKTLRSLGYSYPEIGRAINRTHSSVLSLVKKECPDGWKTRQKKILALAKKWQAKHGS